MQLLHIVMAVAGWAGPALAQEPAADPGKGWEVSGVVRTESGPLKGVYMRMVGSEQQRRHVKTDSQGRYRFVGSIPGTYTIHMEKPEDASEAKSRTLTLAQGDKVQDFDFLVRKGAVIAGKVLDRSGRPVSGMVVIAYAPFQVQGRSRLSEMGGAVTNDKGEYRIAHLPDRTYLVAAVPVIRKPARFGKRLEGPTTLAPAYPPVTFAPSGRSIAAAAHIEVRGGEERQGVDITMEKEPVYCVYFRPMVTMADVEPGYQVAGMLVETLDVRGPQSGSGSVKAGEDTQICGLPEGDYRLGIFAYLRQSMKGLGFGQIEATVGKRHLELGAVEVTGMRELKGKVSVRGSRPDAPVPGGIRLVLELWNRSLLPSDTLQGEVERDGSFSLRQVYQGTYGLRVENLPQGHFVSSARQAGRDVTLEGVMPGDAAVDIELDPAGPVLTGRVLTGGDEPKPVVEATVFLVPDRGSPVRSAQSDQIGAYRFESAIAPGEYRIVAVEDLPESQRSGNHAADRFMDRAVRLKLNQGESKDLDLTALKSR